MKSKLKAPGTKRLKLRYDHLLSIIGFNSNLRRYSVVLRGSNMRGVIAAGANFIRSVGRCRLNQRNPS